MAKWEPAVVSDSTGTDWKAYADGVAIRAQQASRALLLVSGAQKNAWLRECARRLQAAPDSVLQANQCDLAAAPGLGLNAAAIDRLRLTPARLAALATALEEIAALPDPVGEVIDGGVRPNGLQVRRVRVPLGVVFFIYESRPNVTIDAAAICVKSGNAVILRGGKEAYHSNLALYQVLREALLDLGLPPAAVQLVETTDRAVVGHFLAQSGRISVTIPRGGKGLIERVVAEARMPVIKHFDGICHVYVDRAADLAMARQIILNAKCQRPGVCNAAETLLVHREIAPAFLPLAAVELQAAGVELRGCAQTQTLVPGCRAATGADFHTEYLDLILSVRIVADLAEAIEHIATHSSQHTEAIVTADLAAARQFVMSVDSSAVMVNASTRFNDGGELGLGAEIGISTDKLHARGPCGLRELTSYKYIVEGTGQVRG